MPDRAMPRFRLLASGQVQQTMEADDRMTFDPDNWATYRRGEQTVKAVRIPGRFQVGGDVCKDGWLVVDDKGLAAIPAETFGREYRLELTLGEAA